MMSGRRRAVGGTGLHLPTVLIALGCWRDTTGLGMGRGGEEERKTGS